MRQVKAIGLKDTILATCCERADSLSDTVILHVHDLHAGDAVYHQTCNVNFRTLTDLVFRLRPEAAM